MTVAEPLFAEVVEPSLYVVTTTGWLYVVVVLPTVVVVIM
jgi:hypothetical protein